VNPDYYQVRYGDVVIAEGMTIETACLLVEALFQKYWQEPEGEYIIAKMPEEPHGT